MQPIYYRIFPGRNFTTAEIIKGSAMLCQLDYGLSLHTWNGTLYAWKDSVYGPRTYACLIQLLLGVKTRWEAYDYHPTAGITRLPDKDFESSTDFDAVLRHDVGRGLESDCFLIGVLWDYLFDDDLKAELIKEQFIRLRCKRGEVCWNDHAELVAKGERRICPRCGYILHVANLGEHHVEFEPKRTE